MTTSEPAERVATVQPVSESNVDSRVAAIFEDIKRTKNLSRIPNFWRTIATSPSLLEMVWTSLKKTMHPEATNTATKLDARTREIIALAVSATNSCDYCINSHTTALMKLGVDQETLGEIMAVVGLFNMTNSLANGYKVKPDVLPPQ